MLKEEEFTLMAACSQSARQRNDESLYSSYNAVLTQKQYFHGPVPVTNYFNQA